MDNGLNIESDNWEDHWNDYSSVAEENPAQNFRRKIIIEILKKDKIEDHFIIDFGSGQGDLIKDLSKDFYNAKMFGFELSKIGVSISKVKVPKATFIQKNLLENNSMDYISIGNYGICSEVLEHLDEPIIFLKNIKQNLKDQAKLIVTVPGGKMSKFERHIGHRKHYTKHDLESLLIAAGYKDVKVEAYGFPFFNIYKLITIFRGEKLINDVKDNEQNNKSLFYARFVMKIFDILFRLNLNHIPFGWQTIAIAKVEKKE
jgi:SAM-dependent methyltransferase